MKSLNEYFEEFGTDKQQSVHNYAAFYERYLSRVRDEPNHILEIGVHKGSSIKAFASYLPNSTIVGVDINKFAQDFEINQVNKHPERGDIIYKLLNMLTPEFEDFVKEYQPGFDFVIDDASHQNSHIIQVFEKVFPYLKSGGIYFIEDIHASFHEYFGIKGEAVNFFKGLIDKVTLTENNEYVLAEIGGGFGWRVGNKNDQKVQESEKLDYYNKNIKSILFSQGMIIIEKL